MWKCYGCILRRKALFLLLLTLSLLIYVVLRGLGQHNVSEIPSTIIKGNDNIVIFVVVKSASDLTTEYEIAHSTLRCYCAARRYPLVILDFSSNSTLSALCPQSDVTQFMFRRHCALARFLSDNSAKVEWVLFLDADIGVVNPTRMVEEYLPQNMMGDGKIQSLPDLVFYERIFNEEKEGVSTSLLLLTDFRQFWARDIWLTGSEWNEKRDFFLHGFKRKWQNSTKWGGWFSPFNLDNAKLASEMTAINCAKSGSRAKNLWKYEPRFMISMEKLDNKLFAHVREMRMQQMDYWRRVEEYALEEWEDATTTL
uniref:Nucleotide-diphospho-sugar transferase domain-containing protein n=1 Tax=Meloidogyne javanica TaxID=6303 RepID=A0A915MBS6_MELJA